MGGSETEIETLEIRGPCGAIDTVTSFMLYSKEKELYLPSKSGHWGKGPSFVRAGPKVALAAGNRGFLEWSNENLPCGSPETFVS